MLAHLPSPETPQEASYSSEAKGAPGRWKVGKEDSSECLIGKSSLVLQPCEVLQDPWGGFVPGRRVAICVQTHMGSSVKAALSTALYGNNRGQHAGIAPTADGTHGSLRALCLSNLPHLMLLSAALDTSCPRSYGHSPRGAEGIGSSRSSLCRLPSSSSPSSCKASAHSPSVGPRNMRCRGPVPEPQGHLLLPPAGSAQGCCCALKPLKTHHLLHRALTSDVGMACPWGQQAKGRSKEPTISKAASMQELACP